MKLDQDYRYMLRNNLSKRMSLNPKYSLRAYARDLSISSGQLSLVLNGKKGLSTKRAEKIFSKLNLEPKEARTYLLQVASEHSRSKIKRQLAIKELNRVTSESSITLTKDMFDIISDWEHFAVLQCLSLKGLVKSRASCQKQEELIAQSLKLSMLQVSTALERMSRIELVEKNNDRWHICQDTVFTTDGVPSQALRNFHTQVLKKAIEAIELQSIEERYPNTIMLPILAKDFENIKREVLTFQTKIMNKYGRVVQQDGEKVYALTQQFFKISEDV